MDDHDINRAFEGNHAAWWTLDAVIRGEDVHADPRFAWGCDPSGGGACLHLIRLGDDAVETAIEPLIDAAARAASAIWAYAAPDSRPDALIERMRAMGFQHAIRYPVLGVDLERLPEPAVAPGGEVAPLLDLARFDKETPLPGVGPITTKTRRAVAAQSQARFDHAPERICRMVSHEEGVAASVATVFVERGFAGLYDVATLEGQRGRGLARQTALAALIEARARGASHAGAITSNQAAALYAKLGFRPVGWLSLLYYSKTKLARRRAAAAP